MTKNRLQAVWKTLETCSQAARTSLATESDRLQSRYPQLEGLFSGNQPRYEVVAGFPGSKDQISVEVE